MKNKTIVIYLLSMIFILIGLIFISLTLKNEKEIINEEKDITITTKEVETTSEIVINFTVEDRTKTCAQAIEVIYEDDNYRYTLSCMKSGSIYLVYNDGSEVTLKNALANGMVTIDELKASNLQMNIETK